MGKVKVLPNKNKRVNEFLSEVFSNIDDEASIVVLIDSNKAIGPAHYNCDVGKLQMFKAMMEAHWLDSHIKEYYTGG